MRIRFETKIDDVIAFNYFHYANSHASRWQLWMQVLLWSVVGGIALTVVCLRPGPFPGGGRWAVLALGIPYVGLTFACVMIHRCYTNLIWWRNLRKYLADDSNRVMFGWVEMELLDNRLIINTELVYSSLDLRAIEKIVGNEDYTYVYFDAVAAYCIPMHLYPEDEYRAFVADLRAAWDQRESPRPAETDAPARQPDERIIEKPH